jgi:hypothetical protein
LAHSGSLKEKIKSGMDYFGWIRRHPPGAGVRLQYLHSGKTVQPYGYFFGVMKRQLKADVIFVRRVQAIMNLAYIIDDD